MFTLSPTFTIHSNSTSTNWLAPANGRSDRADPDRRVGRAEEQPRIEAPWVPLGFLTSGKTPTIREVRDWLGEKPRKFLETIKPITAGGSVLAGFGTVIGLFCGNEIIGGALTAFGIFTTIVGALSGPNLEPNTLDIRFHNNNPTPTNQFQFSTDSFAHPNNTVFCSSGGSFANVQIVAPEFESSPENPDTASPAKAIKRTHSKPNDEIAILLQTLKNTRKPKAVPAEDFLNARKDAATKLGEKISDNSLSWVTEKKILNNLIARITKSIRPDGNKLRIHVTNTLVDILLKSDQVNNSKRVDLIAKGLMNAIVTCSEDIGNHDNKDFQEELVAILRKTEHPVIQRTLASLEQDGKIT